MPLASRTQLAERALSALLRKHGWPERDGFRYRDEGRYVAVRDGYGGAVVAAIRLTGTESARVELVDARLFQEPDFSYQTSGRFVDTIHLCLFARSSKWEFDE